MLRCSDYEDNDKKCHTIVTLLSLGYTSYISLSFSLLLSITTLQGTTLQTHSSSNVRSISWNDNCNNETNYNHKVCQPITNRYHIAKHC